MGRRNYPVTGADRGRTILEFLVDRGYQESVARLHVEAGEILVNGEPVAIDDAVKPRDIVCHQTARRDRSSDIPAVLHEDDRIIAYDKPSGRACVEERNRLNSGLLGLLRRESGHPDGPPYLVHRLDKGTSGVWVVAKTLEAKRDLTAQFENREVVKQYRCQVQGILHEKEGVIEAPIGPSPRNPVAVVIDSKGRPATTRYKVLRQFRRFAIVRCWPETGRTHQIRVHMRHLGHPLIVDDLYGGIKNGLFLSKIKPGYQKPRHRPERPLIARLTLHCESMELRGCDPGTTIRVESPLPKDLARLERNLQNYA